MTFDSPEAAVLFLEAIGMAWYAEAHCWQLGALRAEVVLEHASSPVGIRFWRGA